MISVRSWHVQVLTNVPIADVWLKVGLRLATAVAKAKIRSVFFEACRVARPCRAFAY